MITTTVIIISLVFYIFYKIKYFQATTPTEKKWVAKKGNMAIGVFLLAFGLNQIVIATNVALFIGTIFILLGSANVYFGYQGYKHYLPYVVQEARVKN